MTNAPLRLRQAWHAVTPLHWKWGLGLATLIATAETISILLRSGNTAHWLALLLEMVLWYSLTALLILFGLALLEAGDSGLRPPIARYLALALLISAFGGVYQFAVYEVSARFAAWAGLPDFNAWMRLTSVNAVPLWIARFVSGLFIVGGGIFAYVYLRNGARMARTLAGAEARSAEARRALLANDLAATQALVDPRFLFETLKLAEHSYEKDPVAGDRVLEALITYLRSALPLLESEPSTLGRQGQLVQAYLQVEQARIGNQLDFAVDVPHELADIPFPPMLVLPLVEDAIRQAIEPRPAGGRIDVVARSIDGGVTVSVSHDKPDGSAPSQGASAALDRLAGLFGDRGRLVVVDGPDGKVTTRIEVQYEEDPRGHR